MPYILQESRKVFDPKIKDLSKLIISGGQLNYVITRLSVLYLEKGLNKAWREQAYYDQPLRERAGYTLLSERVWAHLTAAAQEWYRRMIAPYEDTKKGENGDVYEP